MGRETEDSGLVVRPGIALKGTTTVPGDKSISHRAVLLGMLGNGTTEIDGWLAAGDTEASLRTAMALGVNIEREGLHKLAVHGGQLQKSDGPLDLVNAGTGIRLLAGIMAGQAFKSVLDGSDQLRRRPMKRIIDPLIMMGAKIKAEDMRAPMTFYPADLKGIEYQMPMASAQVKSAVLLAGIFADGVTTVVQPGPARDHTERMLKAMGADVEVNGNCVTLTPGAKLEPMTLAVPGDFSSAAFLIVAALLIPGSDLTIKNVNLNPTRTGLFDVLLEMGADIEVSVTSEQAGEPMGDLHIKASALKGIEIGGELVVRMIDEFPILMVAALQAEGEMVVRDAQELRVKETDRLAVMSVELRRLGAEINETEDGFHIKGPQRLDGAVVDGHDDHRVAMSLIVAGLIADEQTVITDSKCAGDSFPGFVETLSDLGGRLLEAERF